MTTEDAVAWCASHEVSVIFRPNGTERGHAKRSVVVLLHGTGIKGEKPTLAEAVEEVAQRYERALQVDREIRAARLRAETDARLVAEMPR